uniref:Very long-chain fatty acid transport protein n=1 Tax=Cacopsylla melanoneura TaxID=428564 RepID=A0A8D9A1V5_9HEMI
MLSLIIQHIYFIARRLYFILLTFPRDIILIYSLLRSILGTKRLAANNATLVSEFKASLKKHPDRDCYYYEDQTWTLRQIDEYSNRIARILQNDGYKKHDVVALMCENRPEYVGMWLGAAKLGIVTALINTNLKKQPLIHSIETVGSKALVVSSLYYKEIQHIRDSIPHVRLYLLDDSQDDLSNISQLLKSTPCSDVTPSEPLVTSDSLLYIFTSGTTGLPKAAIMPNFKVLLGAQVGHHLLSLGSEDVIYNCLPLYHSSGGLIGTIPALVLGSAIAIRTKFSATNYFRDCAKYKCNTGLYIGELCRYLLASKESEADYSHQVVKMIGVGMRGDVWSQFVKRFHVPRIIEFYGATEGNANLVNTDNTEGAVGIIPTLLPTFLHPVAIIRYDLVENQPVRDIKTGLCVRCKYNEPGMIIGEIKQSDPSRHYYGYADKKESAKKVLENVFSKGDRYFLSGDLMVMDERGYLYFKDRTGDTYRWKGENVSTMEVEAIISKYLPNTEFTVYGVKVGVLDGRAGMIAIVDNQNQVDLSRLIQGLDTNLPVYARPLFIRIMNNAIETTGTFKIKKVQLQNEGFNPGKISDTLYVRQGNEFVRISPELHERLVKGEIKL